jgi:hypothetical protein
MERFLCVWTAVVLVGLVLTLLWIMQFIRLMRMPDAAFPGRYDKVLWVVTFLVIGLLAPFIFVLSGVARRPVVDYGTDAEDEEGAEEEPEAAEPNSPPVQG